MIYIILFLMINTYACYSLCYLAGVKDREVIQELTEIKNKKEETEDFKCD